MGKYFTLLKRTLIAIFIAVCCGYVVLFCLKNSTIVDIDLFFIQLTEIKLELALVVSFISGGLVGLLSSIPLLFSVRKKYRRLLKTQKNKTQKEPSEIQPL